MNHDKHLQEVADQLSDSNKRIIYLSVLGDTIVTLNILKAHTRKMLEMRSFKQVHSCMDLANRMYESGNNPQKQAVINIYINAFQDFQLSCTTAEWHLVKALMPGSIYKEYIKHKDHIKYVHPEP